MLGTLLSRRVREKSRSRKFIPSSPAGERDALLEGRSMAVPALFMWQPPLAPFPPNTTNAQVVLNGTTVLGASTDLVTSNATGNVDVNVQPVWFTDPMMGTSVLIAPGADLSANGSAFTQVNDLVNPGNASGFGNVGNYAISASTVASVVWQGTAQAGSPQLFTTIGAQSNWSRSYLLADTNPGGPGTFTTYGGATPEFLIETFSVNYDPPDPSAGAIPEGGATLGTIGVPGLTVGTAIAGNTLIPIGLTVGTTPIPVFPDPVTGAFSTSYVLDPTTGSTASVSGTPTSINVTASIPIGAVNNTDPTGVVVGIPVGINVGAGVGAAVGTAQTDTLGGTDLTTNFTLSFSNYRQG